MVVMPIIGILLGGVDFSGFVLQVGEASIKYGVFLQSIFDFVIIALAVFMAIKALSRLQKKEEAAPAAPAPIPEDIMLLREIRDSLRK